jgi:hypothetical protein
MHTIKLILTSILLSISSLAEAEVTAVYAPLTGQRYAQAASAFQRIGLLEQIAISIDSTIRIPSPLSLVAKECGYSNASYSSSSHSITLCYELMEEVISGVAKSYPNVSGEKNVEISVGALLFILNHEMGHALVDILKLPIFAREEDTADAIASYFQLRGKNPLPSLIGAIWFFGRGNQEYTAKHFGNEHSLGPQRQANILCFAAGSNPERFSALAEKFGLPPERAERCPGEYRKLETSVRKLLGQYIVR